MSRIVDGLISQLKETEMYFTMSALINDSDLYNSIRNELFEIYQDGENAEFLVKAFLQGFVGDNLQEDPDNITALVAENIRAFK